ncbi:MAG: histone deacetylase [Phycisphaerae bacterium]
MATGLVYDPFYLAHDTGDLPEKPERLLHVMEYLDASGILARLVRIPARVAELAVVQYVHPDNYLKRLQKAVAVGDKIFETADVALCPKSWDVALLAVGGVLAMCDAVMGRMVDNGFCAIRPPGHHARHERSEGFCLLNNVAIAARYLQKKHGLQRIAIVDWDLHHGDGTQHIFEEDPSVLFISLHEHPAYLYPGTGYAWERGKGPGEGFTLNLPMQPESDDADYQTAFAKYVIPALQRFAPQAVLISAGFDAHMYDPLGHLRLSSVGYAWMTRQLKNLAQTACNGRLISVLEGGYDVQALAWSVQTHLEVLAERTVEESLMDMKSGMWE